jgi:thiamine monophosphate synthase
MSGTGAKILARAKASKANRVKSLIAKLVMAKATMRASNRPLAINVRVQNPVKLANKASHLGKNPAKTASALLKRKAKLALGQRQSLMLRRSLKCLPRKWPVRCLKPRKG